MRGHDFWNLMNLFCRSHPWHGVEFGSEAPQKIHCYIEIVPTDTIKYELDKTTGLLKVDRPQQYSNYCPALYGLVPQTLCGKRIGDYAGKKVNREGIKGDGDPIDICVLTEKTIPRGDILMTVVPIGGLRAIDGDEADDKIIAVLKDDLAYKAYADIKDCPSSLIDRLSHYFLTYKDYPDQHQQKKRKMEITHIYGREEAHEILMLAHADYNEYFAKTQEMLKMALERP